MAEQDREQQRVAHEDNHILLEHVDTDYFDTAGDERNTIWDDMVQALKPDLTPKWKK